jgi:hypothetical protein
VAEAFADKEELLKEREEDDAPELPDVEEAVLEVIELELTLEVVTAHPPSELDPQGAQMPLMQAGVDSGHTMPQPPQFFGSESGAINVTGSQQAHLASNGPAHGTFGSEVHPSLNVQ